MILYHLIKSNIPNTLPNAVRERFQFKQTFEFVSPYSQIWPPTSTNDSEHTDQKVLIIKVFILEGLRKGDS